MTISTERLADSAYVEAMLKSKEASEQSVCVIIKGKPTWISPRDILIGSISLADMHKEYTAMFTKCSETINNLTDKINQLIDVANKQTEDITHLYNAVEQGEF